MQMVEKFKFRIQKGEIKIYWWDSVFEKIMRQNQNHHLATLPNHPQSVESQFINNKKVCLFYLLIISINQMAKGLQEDHGAMTQVTRNWDVTIE